ncbi:MAG: pseudaminic acid cytidylyltransferase [Pseudomonadota bacterium]
MKRRIAVIPARGGSKRIPRKNIRPFGGKPMMAWPIEAAIASGCFDQIIVSTDDEEIAEVARELGAQVPFMRSKALADEHTGTIPVIHDAAKWAIRAGLDPEYICCIYATAAFLDGNDLRESMDKLAGGDASYVFSVTDYGYPVQRALRRLEDGGVEMLDPTKFDVRSQDLETVWHDAGQFYWGRASAWLGKERIFTSRSIAHPLPRYRVQDIDTLEDWRRAELMWEALTRT